MGLGGVLYLGRRLPVGWHWVAEAARMSQASPTIGRVAVRRKPERAVRTRPTRYQRHYPRRAEARTAAADRRRARRITIASSKLRVRFPRPYGNGCMKPSSSPRLFRASVAPAAFFLLELPARATPLGCGFDRNCAGSAHCGHVQGVHQPPITEPDAGLPPDRHDLLLAIVFSQLREDLVVRRLLVIARHCIG